MADGSGKLRSACDSCHQMKIRCSGNVPCEGCLTSGRSCFYSYSGRLGRPRGTKNKRTTHLEGSNPPRRVRTAPETEKGGSGQSSRQQSPSQSAEPLTSQPNNHQQPSRQQAPVHQTTDSFISNHDDSFNNQAILNTIMNNSTNNAPLNITGSDPWDARSFCFPGSLLIGENAQTFQGSSIKVSQRIFQSFFILLQWVNETLPLGNLVPIPTLLYPDMARL